MASHSVTPLKSANNCGDSIIPTTEIYSTSGGHAVSTSLGNSFDAPAYSSTPNISFQNQSTDIAAMQRISELEEQLMSLKQTISTILLAQEKMATENRPQQQLTGIYQLSKWLFSK